MRKYIVIGLLLTLFAFRAQAQAPDLKGIYGYTGQVQGESRSLTLTLEQEDVQWIGSLILSAVDGTERTALSLTELQVLDAERLIRCRIDGVPHEGVFLEHADGRLRLVLSGNDETMEFIR